LIFSAASTNSSILNTVCYETAPDISTHILYTTAACYKQGGAQYDLVAQDEAVAPTAGNGQHEMQGVNGNATANSPSANVSMGRGRGATLPSWMTSANDTTATAAAASDDGKPSKHKKHKKKSSSSSAKKHSKKDKKHKSEKKHKKEKKAKREKKSKKSHKD
jgi:hypothetical protein